MIRPLFNLFIKRFIQFFFLILFAGFILLVLAHSSWGSRGVIQALPIIFGLPVVVFMTLSMSQFNQNLHWVRTLPLKRRDIYICRYLLGLFSLALVLICYFIFGVGIDFLLNPAGTPINLLLDLSRQFIKTLFPSGNFTSHLSVLFCSAAVIHIYCSVLVETDPSRRLLYNETKIKDLLQLKKTWIFLIISLGVLVLSVKFIGVHFFKIALLLVGAYFGLAYSAIHYLRVAGGQRRKWLMNWFFVALIQIGIIYASAIHDVRSNNLKTQVYSTVFLGAFNPYYSTNYLAELLQKNLRVEDLNIISPLYFQRFERSNDIELSEHPEIDFKKLIGSKTSSDALLASAGLLRWENLRFSHLEFVAKQLQNIPISIERKTTYFTDAFFEMLQIRLSAKEVSALLDSGSPFSIQFALIWLRYNRDPSLIPSISKNISVYPDDLALLAATTLSILYGEKMTLNQLDDIKRGKAIALQFRPTDCTRFQFNDLSEILPKDIPELNICLRNQLKEHRAYSYANAFESAGWIELPLSNRLRALVVAYLVVDDS